MLLSMALVVASLLAWYVGRRTVWAFSLPRHAQRVIGVIFVAGILAALIARTLGPGPTELAAFLGAVGGTVVLGIVISAVMLVPTELLRLGLQLTARRSPPAAPQGSEREEPAATPAVSIAPPLPGRRAFIAQAAAGTAVTFGMSASAYGTLFGRHDYQVETVPIRLAKLPKALDGLTIVQLSDIHVGTFVREAELSAARALVRDAKADLVVMTGDLLDHDPNFAPLLARFARSIAESTRYGVFAVPGNHDHYAGAATVLRMLREAGTEVLLNRHLRIGDKGGALALGGVDDVAGPNFGSVGPDPRRAFQGASPELARVLLSHNPAFFRTAREHADLTLSGHTHGGQITLFINPAELVLRHGLVRGHYDVDGSQLYVNRGFGTAGPPSRIGSPPEVTRLVLTV